VVLSPICIAAHFLGQSSRKYTLPQAVQVSDNFMLICKVLYGTAPVLTEENTGFVIVTFRRRVRRSHAERKTHVEPWRRTVGVEGCFAAEIPEIRRQGKLTRPGGMRCPYLVASDRNCEIRTEIFDASARSSRGPQAKQAKPRIDRKGARSVTRYAGPQSWEWSEYRSLLSSAGLARDSCSPNPLAPSESSL
jgi:hypothetical protein